MSSQSVRPSQPARPGQAERRRRRRLLYLVGLVPALLLLMVSARIVLLLHHQGEAMSDYAAGDFEAARDEFGANRVLNPVERWVAPFGEGGARYRLEDFEGAVAAFEESLEVVPEEHECVVRVNLALSHEALGDSLSAEGDEPAALDAWLVGREVIRPCKELAEVERKEQRRQEREDRRDEAEDDQLPEGSEQDRTELEVAAQDASVRVDARLTRKLGYDEAPETRTPQEAPPEGEETPEKKERLKDRNKKAHRDHIEREDEFELEPTPPPQEPPVPQW